MLMIAPEFDEFGDSVAPFVPKRITARAAERSRRMAIPRVAVEAAPGWFLSFTSDADAEAWAEAGVPVEIDIRIGGETAHLRTVWSVVEKLLFEAEPRVRAEDLDIELIAALIETHAVAQIEALEAMLGADCAVERVTKVKDHGTLPHLDMRLTANGAAESYPAAIYATPFVLGLLASAWERSERQAFGAAEPAFLLAARVATSSVSRSGLRGLAEGDALLFDRVAPDGGIVLSVGESLTAVGQITETGDVTVGSVFSNNNPLLLGEFLMSDTDFETEGSAAALDEAAIGALPVRLVFEIGRREVTVDELRDMAVGTPISLEKPASSVVDILANGRRVGSGEMVLIGDQLGVKITRLNGNA